MVIELEYEDGTPKTQSTILIELGGLSHLFHNKQQEPYALIERRECYPLESKQFRDYLQREHYRLTGKGANRNAMSDAISTLAAKAKYDGPEEEVYLRVAFHNGLLYIDLCDSLWRVVELDGANWRVLEESPVRFVRPSTARRLPVPTRGGSLEMLRPYINVRDDLWPLVYGFILCCFAPRGPYLHLALIGEMGVAKSTTTRIIRYFVDPSTVPLKQPPKDEEQLLVAAQNNWIVALDNLSGIKPEISDGLCRLSTGGGFSKRKLYTDCDEFAVDIQRPAILNGIDDIATRSDLAQRTITLELQPIKEVRKESEIWEELDAIAPAVFGAILDTLNAGLAYHETVRLRNPPRMADAATWIQACEVFPELNEGAFVKAFGRNQREAVLISLESHPVPAAVIELMERTSEFKGTPTELLERLTGLTDDETRRSKIWPKSPDWLTKTLRRFGSPLRQAGIDVVIDRSSTRREVRVARRAGYEKWRHSRHGVIDDPNCDANDTYDAKNRVSHAEGGPAEVMF